MRFAQAAAKLSHGPESKCYPFKSGFDAHRSITWSCRGMLSELGTLPSSTQLWDCDGLCVRI